jgi:hypothetical protein
MHSTTSWEGEASKLDGIKMTACLHANSYKKTKKNPKKKKNWVPKKYYYASLISRLDATSTYNQHCNHQA